MNVARAMLYGSLSLSIGALVGCVTVPEPLTDEERTARATADLEKLFADQEAVDGPISLSEAMARAIKYNIDARVKLMEKAVAEADFTVAKRDFLPRLAAEAGYVTRSNQSGSSSESLLTGLESLEPSTSQERNRELVDATVAWNVLDFGVSYATAKQRGDLMLVAEEKRRKAIQNIIQDVRVAYWQAVSASSLASETDTLIQQTQSALDSSRNVQAQGLQAPMQALDYQRELLENLRDLLALRQQLETSRTELASLINLKPGTDFQLETPDYTVVKIPQVPATLEQMEQMALVNRPELREEDYRERISRLDVRKAVLRMFPGIEIEAGGHYDSNDFLFHNSWADAGISISWNLFNLLSGPAVKRQQEAKLQFDQMRRLALSMAVLTQVHVAVQRYRVALEDFKVASDLNEVSGRIDRQVQAQREAQSIDELTAVGRRVNALNARLERDLAYAELQNAAGRIYNTLGMDPLPEEVTGYDLESLSRGIAEQLEKLESGDSVVEVLRRISLVDERPGVEATPAPEQAIPHPVNVPGDNRHYNRPDAVPVKGEDGLTRDDPSRWRLDTAATPT